MRSRQHGRRAVPILRKRRLQAVGCLERRQLFSSFFKNCFFNGNSIVTSMTLVTLLRPGKVIGRGGETVREIMQRTGAEIQVPSWRCRNEVKTNQEVTKIQDSPSISARKDTIYIQVIQFTDILRADAPRRLRRISRPSISSQCGLESFWMGTCFRNIFLMFFEKSSWNRNFVGNRRLFWGASEFPKAPAKGFSRRTAANFNLLLRVKAPLCKDFSV